eukprot:5030810-Amphidinium_carterae.2
MSRSSLSSEHDHCKVRPEERICMTGQAVQPDQDSLPPSKTLRAKEFAIHFTQDAKQRYTSTMLKGPNFKRFLETSTG